MTQDCQAAEQLFTGKSEMAKRMRALDWSQTPLGAIETWPQSWRSALSICLNSRFPIAIYWGPEYILLYADATDRGPATGTRRAGKGDRADGLCWRFRPAEGFASRISKPSGKADRA